MTHLIPIIPLAAVSLIYLLIAGITAARKGFREPTIRLLLIFLVVSAGGELLHTLWQLADLFTPLPGVLRLIPIQVVLVLAFLYFHLSRVFLRHQETDWWRPGIVLVIIELLLQGVLLLILLPILRLGQENVRYQQLGLSILIIGWAIFIGGVTLLTLRSYQQAQTPWHRNRIKYWLLGLCLVVLADGLLFADHQILSSGLRLAATLIIVYAALAYRLLDVSQMMRYTLSYLMITFLTIILYLVGFVSAQYVFQEILVLDYGPLAPTLTTALILAILFNPLLQLVQRLVDRLILGRSYDPNLLMREYSASISNILSLDRLAVVILRLIRRAMDIQHAALFLVRRQKNELEQDYFQLQAVKRHGKKKTTFVPSNTLPADSVVATYLSQERRPLTQYDLDMLPRFKKVPLAERGWLTSLKMEVFVPIHAKDEWIGLLALGPKTSAKPYFDSDLTLLSTLADQTAVALQNARLVQDLVKLNQDLKQTYQDLDWASHQLKELDNLKSAFIGVITHELRSPFANIDFSLQLLQRYGLDQLGPNQREQLAQLTSGVSAVKQMIDNLINFAAFLSKRGEMHAVEVDLFTIITVAVSLNEATAAKKQIKLHPNIPPDLPPVSGDPERLTDALHQLINNAVKFTPAGGQVWIRCRPTPEMMRFEVQDTGVGVPADKLPLLWEGFAQMSDPLLRGVEGLGLGLALVQYVARAHHGDVFAQSKEGEGSTFGFQIPLAGQEQ
ncbi:MAG: GAF domain-containing sensor histidine kinase [Anaerolineae bacterium]|nr:GAF domain-containing sensor histidine kinase [Anaerolineae bacterium]